VRSVVYGRAEFIRAQQVAAAGLQTSTGRTVWPAVQVPGEHQREQTDVATRLPIVWSSVIRRSWLPCSRNARESPM